MKSRYEKIRGYNYGKMIIEQEKERRETKDVVKELTENNFSEWNDKLEIMGSICDYYDYVWRFYDDGRLVLADRLATDTGDTTCDWIGENSCGHLEYNSLDAMLIDWLDELEKNEGKEQFSEEILFIRSMNNMIAVVLNQYKGIYILRHIISGIDCTDSIDNVKNKYYKMYNKTDTDEFIICDSMKDVNIILREHGINA